MAAHRRGSVNVFVHDEKGSLEAIATRRAFFALGENLEQQLGAAPVQLQIAQLVHEEQINAPVAVNQFGQLFVISGFDEFVDQLDGQGIADPVSRFGGQRAQGRSVGGSCRCRSHRSNIVGGRP